MTLQTLLDNKKITKYQLSMISGVPKTTILDICSGKSSIQKCSARTVFQIAKALNLTMENIMELDDNEYNSETGMPTDKSHFECGLPIYVQNSLDRMKKSWKIVDSGKKDINWDTCWCELNADLNSAEVENLISSEQAWYLRRKYLRMENTI
ncbi:MAG: helix-turn-helix transcriptional regulator [Ruminococcaceae bacterium]|nr:helix-turn-helix transcriptional regulator [Oscillospiraceae bacterium]